MQEVSSSDLLIMTSIDPTDLECIKAFGEFHRRYYDFVWGASIKLARSYDIYNADNIAMILTQNAFIDIHKNSSVFKRSTDDEARDIKLWLVGIVRIKGKQYLAENNKHKEHIVFMDVIDDETLSIRKPPKPETILISYEASVLKNALKTLSEKEKSVLLSFYNHYTDDGVIVKIDKTVKENLAKQFNVRIDSLKQIKRRAFKKVLDYVELNSKKTN